MIELYTLPGCPYCRSVERKLDDLDLEYKRITVPAFRFRRQAVKEVSGQTGVPVLVDREQGIEGMAESTDIIAYLTRTYG